MRIEQIGAIAQGDTEVDCKYLRGSQSVRPDEMLQRGQSVRVKALFNPGFGLSVPS